jgi:hypothetical protein
VAVIGALRLNDSYVYIIRNPLKDIMKPATLLFAITLSAIASQAHAKMDCTEFTANFIGLEAALKECHPTPRFNAWVAEERAHLAREEKAGQEWRNTIKAPDGSSTSKAVGGSTAVQRGKSDRAVTD